MRSHIDFGYLAIYNYFHLIPAAIAALLLLVSWKRKWPGVVRGLSAVALAWSLISFGIVQFAFDMNGRIPMPTAAFLRSGKGRVLDMGAGTGRSTLMVLENRPETTIVALDSFADSFQEHFSAAGEGGEVLDRGQAKLKANLVAAGVDSRATIKAGDMRELPFEPNSFDAVVSTYAIDHLGRTGSGKALKEVFRVLKPGGEFLMMVISKDAYLKFAVGPFMMHGGTPSAAAWTKAMETIGFRMVEQGTKPATLYFVAQKP